MNDKLPNRPDQPNGSPMGAGRTIPPNSQDPSGVIVGFPSGAVDALRSGQRQLDEEGVEVGVSRQAVDEVLAWIVRYVPRAFACDLGHEIEVGGVGILTIGSEEPFADAIELIRLNGRTFVEETPTIASEGPFTAGRCAVHTETELDGAAVFAGDGEPFCLIDADAVVGGDPMPRAEAIAQLLNEADDGDPHDFAFRLGEALGELDSGQITRDGFAEVVESIVREMVEGEDHNPDGFIHASPEMAAAIADAISNGVIGAACDEVAAFERRPAVEGLECVKALGPGYERDVGGRPVYVGEGEATDAEGRFPGDVGYLRPS